METGLILGAFVSLLSITTYALILRREKEIRDHIFEMAQKNLEALTRSHEKALNAIRAKSLDELHILEIQKERAQAEIDIWRKAADKELEEDAKKPQKARLAVGTDRATGVKREINLSSGSWELL